MLAQVARFCCKFYRTLRQIVGRETFHRLFAINCQNAHFLRVTTEILVVLRLTVMTFETLSFNISRSRAFSIPC